MKPYIEILSRKEAVEFLKTPIVEKLIIISISSVMTDKILFAENSDIVDILYLNFDDVDRSNANAMTSNQAKEVTDFVNKYKDSIDRIVIHCDQGVSRSAGIAAAIMQYLFGTAQPIFSNRKYCPNLHCYKLVLDSFYNNFII